MERQRVVLAFNGRPDEAAAVTRVAERTGHDVVTVTLDLGQGRELESVRQRALDAGAVRAHVIDARERLAQEVILPVLVAGLVAPGGRPRIIEAGCTLAAVALAEVAGMERAAAIAQAADGPEAARMARLLGDLVPDCHLVAPVDGREVPGATAGHAPRAPVPEVHENLWGRIVRLPASPDASADPLAATYALTVGVERADLDPAVVEISVKEGEPVAVNGVSMGLAELIEVVGTIAGDHGVGRSEVVDWATGAREVSESPAAAVLGAALDALERAVLEPTLAALKAQLSATYGLLLDEGRWFSPGREALAAFMESVRTRVSGDVRLQLHGGACRVTGRRVAHAAEATTTSFA